MKMFNQLFDIIVGILFILVALFEAASFLLIGVGILFIVKGVINLPKKN